MANVALTMYYYLSRTYTNENGCMIWKGAKTPAGYSHATLDKKSILVHRYIAFHSVGREDDQSLVVMHECDNPSCINPDHLVIGTQTKNSQDSFDRLRRRGSDHPLTKLTQQQVDLIREEYSKGILTQANLAEVFNVRQPTISKIIRREDWKH